MCQLQQWSRQSRRNVAAVRRLRLARAAVLLPPALLLLWVFCHAHANGESWLAALRDLDQDGTATRDVGRALSLARSLRGRAAPDAATWRATLRLAAQSLAGRIVMHVRDLMAIAGMLRWPL
jgi:hypothetical protein